METFEQDPILQNLVDSADEGEFGDVKVEYRVLPIGDHKEAILQETTSTPTKEGFSRRLKVKFSIKHQELDRDFNGFVDLPRTVKTEGLDAQTVKVREEQNDRSRNTLNTLLRYILGPGKGYRGNVDTDAQYDRLLSVFKMASGKNVPIKIEEQVKKVDGKYKGTGFTKFSGLQPEA